LSAWFAPTGNLILIPFTFLSFLRAAYYWFLANIFVLWMSSILIWRNSGVYYRVWIPVIAVFGFSMTLLSLQTGQVNTLELLGLALFLFFTGLKREYLAGVSLALTTIKPHLVLLTLPLLLLDSFRRKEWRVIGGFAGVLIFTGVVLTGYYSEWLLSFRALVFSGMSTVRETPTITGLLVVSGGPAWGKWVWLGALLIAILLWHKHGKDWDRRTLIDVSVLVGLVASPIGWSYDQIILLFPILRILAWIADGSLNRKDALFIAIIIFAMYGITYIQRIPAPSDVWFFWVPFAVAGVYAFAWKQRISISII